MPEAFRSVITEHAAWRTAQRGQYRVFALPDGGQWLVHANGSELLSLPLIPSSGEPQFDVFNMVRPEVATTETSELISALARLGGVARFRTPDLWEAIATTIIRQVVRAPHAKRLYRDFCQAYGQRVPHLDGKGYALFPKAETVLGLRDAQFASAGLTFKRRPLRAAAEAYLKHETHWRDLPPDALVEELQRIPRIGPWTAGAAVADYSNDFTYYPYADLAVRTWTKRAAPSYPWPDNEQAFGRLWQRLAGDQLATLTLLTLAWGSQHGDTG
jgi:DNA-3-methyladenine glycosylase II